MTCYYCLFNIWILLNSDYTHLVNIIGIFYQVRDDYMNLQSDQVRVENENGREKERLEKIE